MSADASEALAGRESVQQFLNAACTGNLDLFRNELYYSLTYLVSDSPPPTPR
ncbi:hypothetical protein LguiA_007310 [Lonicera macranthoides]